MAHKGKLHTGSKGGKYRIVKGRKVYVHKDRLLSERKLAHWINN